MPAKSRYPKESKTAFKQRMKTKKKPKKKVRGKY